MPPPEAQADAPVAKRSLAQDKRVRKETLSLLLMLFALLVVTVLQLKASEPQWFLEVVLVIGTGLTALRLMRARKAAAAEQRDAAEGGPAK